MRGDYELLESKAAIFREQFSLFAFYLFALAEYSIGDYMLSSMDTV